MGDPERFRQAVLEAGSRIKLRHGSIEELPALSLLTAAQGELEMGWKFGNMQMRAADAYFLIGLAHAAIMREEREKE